MKVTGFDNREYNLQFTSKKTKSKSKGHLQCRELLKEVLPLERVYEEIKLPGSKRGGRDKDLYFDFFIPNLRIAVEVDGKQHEAFNTFFFDTKKDFVLSTIRDVRKEEWCELNNIKLIRLSHNESIEEWKTKILTNR